MVNLQRRAPAFYCPHAGRRLRVQHHLIAVAGRSAIQVRSQRRFGQQSKSVGPALCRRHLVCQLLGRRCTLRLAKQSIGRGLERALDDGAHLGCKTATNHHHSQIELLRIDVLTAPDSSRH